MLIDRNAEVRVWCEASCEVRKLRKNCRHIAALVVDGVTVLFDNPDDRNMAVTFIGGAPDANRKVSKLWKKFDDGLEEDSLDAQSTRDAFADFLESVP